MKIKKRKLKGMTLMEIIVSMVIFSVSALILVQGAISVYNSTRKTKHLVQKINYQAPTADLMVVPDPTNTALVTNSLSQVQIAVKGSANKYTVNVQGVEVVPDPIVSNQPAGNFKYFK